MNRTTAAILIATMAVFATARSHAKAPDGVVVDGSVSTSTEVFYIKSFGAFGDGVAMETEAIQGAIDACHDAGGGVVREPAGDFQFGTIVLKSNVTLSLDHGANLLGSTDRDDYHERCWEPDLQSSSAWAIGAVPSARAK